MRFQFAFTVMLMLGLAGMSATANAQPVIDRHGKARTIADGGEGCRDFLDVDAAHRRPEISGATRVVVTDPNPEEVVSEIAGTPRADSDFPAAGVEG